MVVAMETEGVMAASIGQAGAVVKPRWRHSLNFRSRPIAVTPDQLGTGGEP